MANIQAMLNWMEQRQGKVTYSMANRYGPSSYDCSSAVYYALQAGGFVSTSTHGNTDTLFNDLPNAGFTITTSPSRGDVFLWGRKQSASGRYGHTGIFVDNVNVIHCGSSANGIATVNYQSMLNGAGGPAAKIYKNPAAGTEDQTPSFNTEEEKIVYTIWSILKPLGYTNEAIAGIVGNAVAECDLNPDLSEKGGCGYGLWQWTGNRYPLDGVAAACGAQYTVNLMNAAGITGDYRTATPQTKLMDWTMYHGQWIGKTAPTTVDGFKAVTNVEQATRAFMDNYERPGTLRFEVRLNGANTWYPFLQNLKSGTIQESKGYETLTNVGSLDTLSITKGKVVALGWHFSSGKDQQYIAFINAENDKEIGRVEIKPSERTDVKAAYPNVLGVENSGFSASYKVPNNTAVYIKGIRSDGKKNDELIFGKLIIFEQAFDPEVDTYAATNEKFFFEILSGTKVIKRGNKILNELSWDNELMFTPSTEIVLPIDHGEYLKSRQEIKLYINRKVFHGKITGSEENKQNETIAVSLQHVICEWEYRQVSTNLSAKNRTVNDIYSTLDFRYPEWNIEFLQKSAGYVVDYVYSRQNKLEALTKTCELTTDLFWRVGFDAGRTLDIGTFGEKLPYRLSALPSSGSNIRILTEPVIRHEYENVINMATVYGEEGDSGMSSMSLREIYEEEGAQDPDFPVVILRNRITGGVNNERGYDYIEFTKLAPNNNLEYSVIDSESIALEGGTAIEGTFSFNDLAPFPDTDAEITDEDRAKAAKTAYDSAVRKLKQSRRKYVIEVEAEELPHDVRPGCRIHFIYDNQLIIQQDCTNYLKKILSIDNWFYITGIGYNFDKNGNETNTLTLEKYLRIERESDLQ